MRSVFVCTFILALADYGFAVKVCNQEVATSPSLVVTCAGDKGIKYPNYADPSSYYVCAYGQPQLRNCAAGKYFVYYTQVCSDCPNYIATPDCVYVAERTNLKCSGGTVTTTKAPLTKPPTKSTTKGADTTTRATITRRPTSAIPTPPGPTTPSGSDIPMPPIVVTPAPGVPTPPNENVTPPSLPGTPPLITTVQYV